MKRIALTVALLLALPVAAQTPPSDEAFKDMVTSIRNTYSHTYPSLVYCGLRETAEELKGIMKQVVKECRFRESHRREIDRIFNSKPIVCKCYDKKYRDIIESNGNADINVWKLTFALIVQKERRNPDNKCESLFPELEHIKVYPCNRGRR